MINEDRIVSVTKTDLLTLYGNIMTIAGEEVTALVATTPGEFEVTEAPTSGSYLAAEPIVTIDIADGVTAVAVYFIPAYTYAGFTIAGDSIETSGDEVNADGATLYKAELASGTVTISKVGF